MAARKSLVQWVMLGALSVSLVPGLLLVSSVTVSANAFRIDVPIGVRITTYVNQKPEGIKPEYDWIVANRGTEYRLYILNLLVMTGGVLPGDIEQVVEPYRIKFELAGEKDALQKLKDMPPGQQIVFTAYLQFGAGGRYMMLDTIKGGVEPTVSVTPAQTE